MKLKNGSKKLKLSEEIKLVKCPILNKSYQDKGALDVIIKFDKDTPLEIMCPEFGYYINIYTGATVVGCKVVCGECIYSKWNKLNNKQKDL